MLEAGDALLVGHAVVVAMLGMERMPSATALADWLRRLAGVELRGDGRGGWEDGLRKVQDLFYEMAAQVLREMRGVVDRTLDFDAMCIEESKKCATWMYTGEQGNDRLKNQVTLGALPCRGEHGLSANRAYAYLRARSPSRSLAARVSSPSPSKEHRQDQVQGQAHGDPARRA